MKKLILGALTLLSFTSLSSQTSFAQKSKIKDYGSNIIRISPFKYYDIAPGLGLSYEKIFSNDNKLGFEIPLTIALEDFGSNQFSEPQFNTHFFISPTLKVYPWGQRTVTFSFGPSFVYGYSTGKSWRSVPTPSGGQSYADYSRSMFALIINNYLNFQIGENISAGIEVGAGVRYFEKEKEIFQQSQFNRSNTSFFVATGQFAFNLGFRF